MQQYYSDQDSFYDYFSSHDHHHHGRDRSRDTILFGDDAPKVRQGGALLNSRHYGEEIAHQANNHGIGFTQPGKDFRSVSRRQNQALQVNSGKVHLDVVSF